MAQNETFREPNGAPPPLPENGAGAEGVENAALDPQSEIERLNQELAEAQNRFLRSQADLDNFRKRSRREMDDERKYAFMPLVKDLCPFVDNLERALEAAQKNPNPSTILEGIKMVAQQLEEVLARHACTRIDALDQPFDPNMHQAILQQPAADKPANTVLHVAQVGFQLHDRVVRPAQVIVSSGPQG